MLERRQGAAPRGTTARLRYLDGLRGIASLGVALFAHYDHFALAGDTCLSMQQAPGYRYFAPLYGYSWTAVELFFVISGVVFASIYADRLPGTDVFFKRRLARLYPLHLATLIAVAILVAVYHQRFGRPPVYQNNDAVHFLLNLLFIQFGVVSETYSFNGPSYSLAIEAAMYVLFYVSARFFNLVAVAWTFSVGGMLFVALPHPWHHLPLINNAMALGAIGFFGGVIIARRGRLAWLLPLAAIALAPFSMNLFCKIYAVIFAVMLAIRWCAPLQRLLGAKLAVWFGDRSLTIYLLHFPLQVTIVLVLGRHLPFASWSLLLAYAIVLTALAEVVHRFFDVPAKAWILSVSWPRVREWRGQVVGSK